MHICTLYTSIRHCIIFFQIYLYSGDCTTDYSLLTDVCIASRQMGLHDLQEICENALNNEGFRNMEIQNKTKQARLNKLFDLAIKQGLCTGTVNCSYISLTILLIKRFRF